MTVTNGVEYPERPETGVTMAGMGRIKTGAHARVGVLASVVRENPLLAAVAGIGFAVSFQTIARLAREHGMPGWPVLYPLGIDVGILAMFAEALHLIRQHRSDLMPRAVEWLLSGITVYINVHGSPSRDWVGAGLHAVMPGLWVACLELVRHRRVAEARTSEPIPWRRWVASPWPSARLWLRMQRDGITSYRLALELEQARLHARDLVRAAPPGQRPERSSLLCKRIRSGRLTESVRRAVVGSLAGEYAPGWEDEVTAWVTGALALPAHLAASLENTRAAIAGSMPGAAPEAVPGDAPERVPETAPSEPEAHPGTSLKPAPKQAPRIALKLAPGKARGMSPEQVARHVGAMIEEYGDVSLKRVKDDLHVGGDKAAAALEIARGEMRRRTVVPFREAAR